MMIKLCSIYILVPALIFCWGCASSPDSTNRVRSEYANIQQSFGPVIDYWNRRYEDTRQDNKPGHLAKVHWLEPGGTSIEGRGIPGFRGWRKQRIEKYYFEEHDESGNLVENGVMVIALEQRGKDPNDEKPWRIVGVRSESAETRPIKPGGPDVFYPIPPFEFSWESHRGLSRE